METFTYLYYVIKMITNKTNKVMKKLEELERLIDERIEYFFDNNKYSDGSAEDWLEWVMDGSEIEDSDYDAVVTYMKEVMPDEDWSFYEMEQYKYKH